MSEWKDICLKDFIETNRNSIGREYPFSIIQYLDTGSITSNKIDSLQEFNLIDAPSRAKRLVENDDIIYSSVRPNQLHYGFIKNPPKNLVVSTGFVTITCKKSRINPLFLFYNLTQNQTTEYLHSIAEASTSAYPSLKPSDIESLKIILPPLPEQTAIASVLSSLDDKIDLLHRQNTNLEKMAETVFRQWFVEEAKEQWESNILNEFVSVKHGYAFKGTFISTEPNNLKLVTPGNFKIGGGFKADKFKYYTDVNFPNDYIFQTNDLIITMTDLSVDGDTLGSPAFIPESYLDELYLHNQRVGKVIFKKVISKYFLYNLMRTEDYKMYIHGSASGTSIRHTSPTTICSYLFVKPPNKLLEEFDIIVLPLYNKIIKNQTQIRSLTALRDTLLPKLMSGEVKVSEQD